jgi:hypothetical protein
MPGSNSSARRSEGRASVSGRRQRPRLRSQRKPLILAQNETRWQTRWRPVFSCQAQSASSTQHRRRRQWDAAIYKVCSPRCSRAKTRTPITRSMATSAPPSSPKTPYREHDPRRRTADKRAFACPTESVIARRRRRRLRRCQCTYRRPSGRPDRSAAESSCRRSVEARAPMPALRDRRQRPRRLLVLWASCNRSSLHGADHKDARGECLGALFDQFCAVT